MWPLSLVRPQWPPYTPLWPQWTVFPEQRDKTNLCFLELLLPGIEYSKKEVCKTKTADRVYFLYFQKKKTIWRCFIPNLFVHWYLETHQSSCDFHSCPWNVTISLCAHVPGATQSPIQTLKIMFLLHNSMLIMLGNTQIFGQTWLHSWIP